MGDKAFSFYAPVLWNSLPLELREAQNYDGFKVQLKTYFFKLAFAYWFCFAFYCIWLHCVQRFEKLLLKALYQIKFNIILLLLLLYKHPGLHQIIQNVSARSDDFPDPTESALIIIFLMNIGSDHILPFNFMVSDPQSGVQTLSSAWCMPGFISTWWTHDCKALWVYGNTQ